MPVTESERHLAAWTRESLAEAAGGRWLLLPPEDWKAAGLCAYPDGFHPGQVLLARSTGRAGDDTHGLSARSVRAFAPEASAVMCVDPDPWRDAGLPLLQVPNSLNALIAVAGAARRRFSGRVLAITGSSGKTTVTHLAAHALRAFGPVSHSLCSANMLYGVAWNIAAGNLGASSWVLELALANMQRTAPLAAPDVSIVLNVSEAHLIHWKNVESIARQKSRIFEGMRPGAVAVVNRDMDLFPVFEKAAQKREISLLSFGRTRDASLRLLEYAARGMRFAWRDTVFSAALPLPGEHIAMDCLAVLGAAAAFGLPLEEILARLSSFTPVDGRGHLHELRREGKRLKIVDEAYNANPASMRAALAAFSEEPYPEGSRVLILGDMLELGEEALRCHRDLEEPVRQVKADRILLIGPEMRHLWESVKEDCSGNWYPDTEALMKDCSRWLRDQDVILCKASHGVGLARVVDFLRST